MFIISICYTKHSMGCGLTHTNCLAINGCQLERCYVAPDNTSQRLTNINMAQYFLERIKANLKHKRGGGEHPLVQFPHEGDFPGEQLPYKVGEVFLFKYMY